MAIARKYIKVTGEFGLWRSTTQQSEWSEVNYPYCWVAKIIHSVLCKRGRLATGRTFKSYYTPSLPDDCMRVCVCWGSTPGTPVNSVCSCCAYSSLALSSMAEVRASPVTSLISWLSSFHYCKSETKDSSSTTSLSVFCSIFSRCFPRLRLF